MGIVAAVVVPLVVPVESSGTLSEEQAAGESATFVDIGGVGVHYVSRDYRGEGANPPLFVLLHGFGASTYSWREVIDDISDLGDVVAYDRPAFGLTQRPTSWQGESPYGVDAQMALIAGVIEEFSREDQPVILVGHSAGGTLAAEFGVRYPSDTEALILVAPAILTTGGGPSWIAPLLDIPQVDRIGPLLVGGIAQSGNDLLERSWHNPSLLTQEIRDGYRVPLSIRGWERAFWEFQKAPRSFRVTDDPAALEVPVAIITGDDDRVVATANSRELAGIIPGAELFVIEASGHLPQEETPAEFMAALVEAVSGDRINLIAQASAAPVVSEVFAEEDPDVLEGVDCTMVPCVALTFDDGPGPYTAGIVDILLEYEAMATFYVVGRQVTRWPSAVSLIVESGMELGNHTMNHPRLSGLSPAQRLEEFDAVDQALHSLVGFYPRTIRPPYGDIPTAGIPDQHLRPVVTWSVDALDWRKRSPERIARTVLELAQPGDIILMHEISRRSVDALPAILEGLREKGLRVVSVGHLIGEPGASRTPIERVAFACPVGSLDPGVLAWCGGESPTPASQP